MEELRFSALEMIEDLQYEDMCTEYRVQDYRVQSSARTK